LKVLVLGINPSVLGGRRSPSIRNLHKWLDVLELKYVSFSNIYKGTGEYKDKRTERKFLNEVCPQYDKIIALGSTVGDVLDSLGFSHFTLPHPSPRNRQLNDKAFVVKKLIFCRQYLGNL
jgi:hypothetical protein